VKIGKREIPALYDSGADITCMSEEEFHRIPVEYRPRQEPYSASPCKSASGGQLQIKGIYSIEMEVMNRRKVGGS
jgi:hypothetical protein